MLAEAHLSAIVQSSDDAIVSKDLKGTVISWNPAAELIFGYTAGEMIGQSIRRLIPADRQAEEDEILARIARGDRVKSFETVRLRKDGEPIHVSLTISPIVGPDGTIIGASKIARDVGERRLAEQALRETDRKLRMLAENMSQLAWMARPDGSRIWYNKRWYDFTGLAETALVEDPSDAHHPDHRARVLARYRADVAAGREWEDTFPLRGHDGRYRWFLFRAKPIRNEGGAIVQWFGTATDVTDLLEKESQIPALLMEVNHRSKNMLAVVQALVRRSGVTDPAFLERFEKRLGSLSANQDLLVRRGWATIPMEELCEAQLGMLSLSSRTQVALSGPPIDLSPRTAEILGMAIHELANNAIRHGALSCPEGSVRLSWDETAQGRLLLEWRESGGPAVRQPLGHGFGTTLIRHIPARSLHADVVLDFAPTGAVWKFECEANLARTLGA